MSEPAPPAAPPRRGRSRDRHGRGMRGPLAPPQVPLSLTRSEVFDDLVRDSVARLERHWTQLADVDFAVQEVPREDGAPAGGDDASGTAGDDDGAVPLGALVSGRDGQPDRIVVFRRPVELRSRSRDERALLVHEVVVEQVADLLGLAPESVDPRYGQD